MGRYQELLLCKSLFFLILALDALESKAPCSLDLEQIEIAGVLEQGNLPLELIVIAVVQLAQPQLDLLEQAHEGGIAGEGKVVCHGSEVARDLLVALRRWLWRCGGREGLLG
jgi:hypothetical protein